MIIDYELTIDDLSDFHIYCARHLPVQIRSHRIVKGFLLFLVLICGAASWRYFQFAIDHYTPQRLAIGTWNFEWEWIRSIILLMVGGVFLFLLWRYKYWTTHGMRESIAKKAQSKEIQLSLGHHHVELEPDGYSVQNRLSETRQQWSTVHQVYASDTACYLFNTPCTAYILPRRAVEPAMAWSTFCQMLSDSIDQAAPEQREQASEPRE
jgi:hypothetical protein